jgi:hypothetical protein
MSECRICLESSNSHDFITPCRCSGTAGVVHEQCLQKWRAQCYNNPDKYNKCELCKEEYVVVRQNPKETFYLCKHHPLKIQYWILSMTIMALSLFIGIIDTANNYISIRMIGLGRVENALRMNLELDLWANISYYVALISFLFSICVLVVTKLAVIFRVYQRCNYYKLMIITDFNYTLTLIPYPLLIVTTYDLGITELLCTTGAFLIIITVPMTSAYYSKHNQTIEEINRRYTKEYIMNITYNPLPEEIPDTQELDIELA